MDHQLTHEDQEKLELELTKILDGTSTLNKMPLEEQGHWDTVFSDWVYDQTRCCICMVDTFGFYVCRKEDCARKWLLKTLKTVQEQKREAALLQEHMEKIKKSLAEWEKCKNESVFCKCGKKIHPIDVSRGVTMCLFDCPVAPKCTKCNSALSSFDIAKGKTKCYRCS